MAARADGAWLAAAIATLREDAERGPTPLRTGVAGTGITSATAARHRRYVGARTRVAVADPEHSSCFPAWASGYDGYATGMPARVPGIGRPRVEPAFKADLVDAVVPVPDAASVAAMRHLAERHGTAYGPATGTCFWAALELASRMAARGETGDLVIVAGESGEAYEQSFYDDVWTAAKGLDLADAGAIALDDRAGERPAHRARARRRGGRTQRLDRARPHGRTAPRPLSVRDSARNSASGRPAALPGGPPRRAREGARFGEADRPDLP